MRMTQRVTITENKQNSIETASSLSVTVKEAFLAWLSSGQAKGYAPAVYLSCMDKVSAYLIRRKICSRDLWELTHFDLFNSVYDKAINDKLFRVVERKTYMVFVQVGKAFCKFLKSKPDVLRVPMVDPKPPSQSSAHLTIREAIIRVLEVERQGLTVKQIYHKIIAQELYSFNARDPQGVVGSELGRACVNSTYKNRASIEFSRFERNPKGEKIFFLLSPAVSDNTSQFSTTMGSNPVNPNPPPTIKVWGETVERMFQVWMESEQYAPPTIRDYCNAIRRTVQDFEPLLDAAGNESLGFLATVREFVRLLNQDSKFMAVNSMTRNQLSAALTVFLRFVACDEILVVTSIGSQTGQSDKPSVAAASVSSLPQYDIDVVTDEAKAIITSIVEEQFPNGIRPHSVIDINKLKHYYHEATGQELAIITDSSISAVLDGLGIRQDEKVFAVPSNGKKELAERLNCLIAENHRLIYYDEFYEVHADFLQAMNIFSPALLKTVFLDICPSLHCGKSFLGVTSKVTLESEILRCYETEICLSYEQLKSILPYAPLPKIKQVLSQNSDFILVNKGVYTHISKIEIDENELHITRNKVKAAIAERGFASLASFDCAASLELNPDFSETAVRNGLYQMHLADCYEKRGTIITPIGSVLNSVAVFTDYCLMHDRLTLHELLEFEREIFGSIHSQSLFVAYDTMIRVDQQTFVSDKEIRFDIDAVDYALALFVHTEVIPLQAVTSFTLFPYIDGYSWNWYLLESYCKRFSRGFNYQCLSVNSKNIGAVFRRTVDGLDYIDVLAMAVVAANVELNETSVGDYLFENKYVAQRTTAIPKVIAKAQVLRERRV